MTRLLRLCSVCLAVSVCLATLCLDVVAEAPLPATIQFNRDVRPILSDVCFQCHGPDQNTRAADLRLDTEVGLLGTGDQPGAVKARHPEQSELIRRITSTDPDERMPPPSIAKKLSPRDIAVLTKWVEQGAVYEGHWAFIPPQRPTVPAAANTPAMNAIDHFIQQRLQDEGLTAGPVADRRTLYRRLSFDLTGLPPKPADVERFVQDPRPDAYARAVETLLQSPRFGERMAVYWLDLVRFADTIGYHSDTPRDIAPYRDYVIQAFNTNLPFDRFTVEQLAGDLLPERGLTQQVAAGYNRLLQTTEEGGAQAKEYAAKYLADRVRNVSSVWLAGTVACAECHDHKFDPFTQRDFYSLAAFFADIRETPVGRREPGMLVPSAEQAAKMAQHDEQIAAANRTLQDEVARLVNEPTDWSAELAGVTWATTQFAALSGSTGLELTAADDQTVRVTGNIPAKPQYTLVLDQLAPHTTGLRLEALAAEDLPGRGPGLAHNGNFVLTSWQVALRNAEGKETPVKLGKIVADHSQDKFPVANAIDGNGATGWAILPQTGTSHEAIAEFEQPLTLSHGASLVITLKFDSQYAQHAIGRFRFSQTTTPHPTSAWTSPDVRTALAVAPTERTTAQRDVLTRFLRESAARLAPQREAIAAATREKEAFVATIPRSLVVQTSAPAMVRVLPRGNWMDDSGPTVDAAIPAFLGNITVVDRRANRLDLANWLVSHDNPLTARVMVNRLWKIMFGVGLSKTVEDLGSQGEWPTHPELLDWLAVEFRDSGWDVKHILRLMALSHTYQQSSRLTNEAAAVDPYNRLLSAQNRFRLDAEFVRDNALEIAGLLSPRIGGESVKPYQPDGYWDYLNFPKRTYPQDHGERLYRRGLYTHWQRSFLHPEMLIFDAPSREECVADRPRSNTPQQALTLLNDPAYLEASRVFATRILQQGGDNTDARLEWAMSRAVARPPAAAELQILRQLVDKHLQQYRADPDAARALIGASGEAPVDPQLDPAELAAWTSIARTILNLHETLTRL